MLAGREQGRRSDVSTTPGRSERGRDTVVAVDRGPTTSRREHAGLRMGTGGRRSSAAGRSDPDLSAVAQQEHHTNLRRMRRAFLAGAVLWPLVGVSDWVISATAYPGTLGFLLALRLSFVPLLLGLVWRMYRTPEVGPRLLRALDVTSFSTAAALVGVMSWRLGGLTSSYAIGVTAILVCRATFVAEPWRAGFASNVVVVLAWAAAVLAGALGEPSVRGQLHDPASWAIFTIYAGFILVGAVLLTWGNHTFWALRRQVFENRSIGRYRLRKKIGEGGMGEVWSAWHGALRREVAVKLLRPQEGSGQAAVQRFEREVDALAGLSHPNTIRVFDYGVTEDAIWYYVMELLDGRELAEAVAQEGPLAQARAVHIAQQAARALAEAHTQGIVHRDVKPSNIFLTEAGGERDIVKVLDFGIAKFQEQAEGDSDLHTRTGAIIGTPAYMAPESAAGDGADGRSDIYSLGATLYFMLTGQPPFTHSTPLELVLAQLQETPAPPSTVCDEPISPALEAVVMRCLEKNPADRFQTATELVAALQEAVSGVPPSPEPGGVTATSGR